MTDTTHQEIRAALTAYTDDAPPPTFTYGQVLTSGRRVRRVRRLRRAASGSAVIVAAVGVALVTLPRLGAGTPPAPYAVAGPFWPSLDPARYCKAAAAPPTGPTIAPTSVVNEKNGHPIRIPTEPADHAAARISCYLAEAVPVLLPGSTFHRDADTPAGTVPLQAYASRLFDPARPGATAPPTISASAVVTDDQGVGDIGFGVGSAYETAASATADCTRPCSLRTGPHGETVTVLDIRTASGYRLVNIRVYQGDTIAFASASNGIPGPAATGPTDVRSAEDQRPGRKDLPISVDELINLAAAPELSLFP